MVERAIWLVTRGGTALPGGITRMVSYVTEEWRAAGRRPALHVQDSTGTHGKALMPACFALAFLRVAWAAATRRIALLHIHMSAFGSVARKGLIIHLGRAFRLPIVVHMHGADFDEFWQRLPAIARPLVRATLRRADRFVVLGNSWRRFFVDAVGLDPARVVVLPNAVPGPTHWAPRPPPKRTALLFLAVLEERKGLADLLVALAELRRRDCANWTLDVAGAGDAAPYQAQARALGLDGAVRFLGHQDAAGVRCLLGTSDVLVLPSYAEGLPMAILEAMANGLAVVATPVGDVGDAVHDGITGTLVPPGDIPALAAALRALVIDPARLRRLGAAGRARFLAEYEISQLNARLETLFTELLPPAAEPRAEAPHFAAPPSAA